MKEKLFSLLGWTTSQRKAFDDFESVLRRIPKAGTVKRFLALLLAAAELFGAAAFKTPVHPYGAPLDLTGYTQVVFDDFDGDALNTDLWDARENGVNRCGFTSGSQASVRDGNLILTGAYLDETQGRFGAGWYGSAVYMRQKFRKGYFEIRCICNKDKGFWSAFWLQSEDAYIASRSRGGVGGAEIDIFESMDADRRLPALRNTVTQTVWCNGFDDDDEKLDTCHFHVLGNNIYDEYNTYGVLWTDEEYIFYVNGIETARTSFGSGVSQVPLDVIISLELPDQMPEQITSDRAYTTQMIVDYVRIYQIIE